MAKVYSNPECWNCGSTTSDDKKCPKCGEHLEDDPEINNHLFPDWDLYPGNEAGAFDYLDAEHYDPRDDEDSYSTDEDEPGFGGITNKEIMKTAFESE